MRHWRRTYRCTAAAARTIANSTFRIVRCYSNRNWISCCRNHLRASDGGDGDGDRWRTTLRACRRCRAASVGDAGASGNPRQRPATGLTAYCCCCCCILWRWSVRRSRRWWLSGCLKYKIKSFKFSALRRRRPVLTDRNPRRQSPITMIIP